MFGTLTDGALVIAPNPLIADGRAVHNPTDDMYAAAGYLPIVDTPAPESGGVHFAAAWVETGGRIVKVWTEAEPPAPPVDIIADLAEMLIDLAIEVEMVKLSGGGLDV